MKALVYPAVGKKELLERPKPDITAPTDAIVKITRTTICGTDLHTGFECGVLSGEVAPGITVAIIGSGPIGLAALLTAQFYPPAEIMMVNLDDHRLAVARHFGATSTVNCSNGNAAEAFKKMRRSRSPPNSARSIRKHLFRMSERNNDDR